MKKFLLMLLAAIILFFVLPLVLNMQPNADVSIIGTQFCYLILDMVFMGVIGWKAHGFERFGAFMPIVMVALHVVSQLIFFKGLLPVLIFNYLEIAYMAYLLKKLLDRKKIRDEAKKKQQAFPKSVTRK